MGTTKFARLSSRRGKTKSRHVVQYVGVKAGLSVRIIRVQSEQVTQVCLSLEERRRRLWRKSVGETLGGEWNGLSKTPTLQFALS